MPNVKQGESKDDFLKRCIPIVLAEGTAESNDQAAAICNSMYEKKEMKLETIDMNNIEIFELGKWKGHEFKKEDAEELIKNFENKIAEPYISLDHNPALTKSTKDFFKAMSLGNISKLWLEGKKLMANFKKVPKLIAELINSGSLSKRSVEWWLKFRHANGKIINNVLESVTYHGANGLPAISTLADIPKLFKDYDYNKSIEQGNLVSIELKDKKEVKNMATIEIEKTEYEELLKNKVAVEKFKLDLDSKDKELATFKSDLDSTKEELTQLKTEKATLEKMKADLDKREKESLKNEAVNYVDGIINNDKKLLPKYKDMKVEEYIRLKTNKDEDGLKLFKEELESRDKVVNFGEITKNFKGNSKEEFKNPEYNNEQEVRDHDMKDWENAEEAIQKQMKLKGYTDHAGYMKAGYELGLFTKEELPQESLK